MGLSMEASSASACISLATWVRKEVPSPTPSGRPVAELARLELCTEPSPRDWRKASSTAALVPSSSSASAGGLVCSMRVPVRKVRGDSPGSWLQAAEPGGLALGPIPARGEAAEEELGERARGAGESAGARAEAAEEAGEVRAAEAAALRSQTMKLAVDVGKLQARLIHATSAAAQASGGTPASKGSTCSFDTSPGGAAGRSWRAESQASASARTQRTEEEEDDAASHTSEASVSLSHLGSDRASANKAKFDKMKAQRNAFKDQLTLAAQELHKLRREVTTLRDFQAKYYLS
mmetsp:Transcript_48175/g.89743  ORF Transcript_48175/g.89743 Transcript_48175/m.89743 type:complete len:292 (+) Transcript_48175:509-1384(+)